MARVAANQENDVGLFEIGNRHLERAGVRCIREIELAQAMVDGIATQSAHKLSEQVAFFAGSQRRDQSTEIGPRTAQPIGDESERFSPAGLDQFAVLADHRHPGAIVRVQAFVAVAVAIGQPALVDCFVVARHRAQHFTAARMQPEVRTERIVIADRRACDQLPGAGAEAEGLVGQRANRADVDDVAG